MEYKSLYTAIFAIMAMILWSVDYWKLLKRPQLFIPSTILETKGVNSLRILNFLIGITAWLFLSFAMTGPRKALKTIPSDIEVNDVFLVVDVSKSMLADDLEPNRLEVAKQKLREFAALRPTDRLGVIIFSEKVFTLLPLTTDPALIDAVLSDIRIGGALGSGTNIGDALALAVARAQSSKTKNKVIILLTDGVSNVGNMTPIQAAELAKKFNIKVYTIGLGGQDSAKIPIGGAFGTRYQSIPGGSIDVKTLTEIAQMTNGKTYMAQSKNSLSEILDDIQKLEKTKIQNFNQVVYEELYFQYLLIAVFLFLFHETFKRYLLKEVE